MSRTVLVLTCDQDSFVPERILEEVGALGFHGHRVHTADYPLSLQMTSRVHPDGRGDARLGDFSAEEVVGVYTRRPAPTNTAGLDAQAAAFLGREAILHWRALQDVLTEATWVNEPEAERAVEGHKLAQLRAASRAGLRIPDTLVTNDPERARSFVQTHHGEVVVKLLGALGYGFERATHLPTHRLTPDDLDRLDDLSAGPMCFQPLLRSRVELRVTWVNGEAFVGAMAGGEQPDWRRGHRGDWTKAELDAPTKDAIDRLMRDLGLLSGSIDLLVPTDGGPPYFLEVNPSGEWGHLELQLDLPVARAFARTLVGAG